MAASLDCRLAGEPVRLLAERGIHWPARGRLLIADLHLGKADVFRRAGIGLPRGGTSLDLARLDAMLERTQAAALWVLGDVLHGPANDTAWRATWGQWRERHAGTRFAALVGNHDRALAAANLGIELLGPAVDDGPFALRHHPESVPGRHVLCGHLHPCVSVPELGARRWPAFWLRDDITVLPAFSAFTGGTTVAPAAGEALAVCAEPEIAWLVPPPPERLGGP